VVNKPVNLNFHDEGSTGLVTLLVRQLQLANLYPVHRLDKMTSGLLVFALNKETAKQFMLMFKAREVEKYYLAISTEKPKKKQGVIKGDMTKARRGSWKLCQTNDNPAMTRFISKSVRPNERAFLLKPYTGKTHQLRVALKSIATPIAGDKRYQKTELAGGEDRGYLHAFALRFSLDEKKYSWVLPPNTGRRFLAKEFKMLLADWSEPWNLFNASK